jgi:hypothetical protein
MLSRVADSLYWMSRYLERAEHTARVVAVNLNLSLDRVAADGQSHRGRLSDSLPAPPLEGLTHVFALDDPSPDLANRAALAACLTAARENARQASRPLGDVEQLNRLQIEVRDAPRAGRRKPTGSPPSWRCSPSRATDTAMASARLALHPRRMLLERAGTRRPCSRHFEEFLDDPISRFAMEEFVSGSAS